MFLLAKKFNLSDAVAIPKSFSLNTVVKAKIDRDNCYKYRYKVSLVNLYFISLSIKRYIMTKFTKSNWMTRGLQEKLNIVGEQFRLARLRRDLTMDQVAQRAQCSRLTLARLEKGSATVSFGTVTRVLNALQLENDILSLAKDDELGHMIQDLEIKNRKRASKR
ncbi:hypothetical protein GCM10019997_21740 [Prevotella corporis]|jgi:hypothetical protein